MLNKWYHHAGSEAVLSTEYELLRRILFKLLPKILIRLFRQPVIALRQLWVMITVLSCVAFGYVGYRLSSLWGRSRSYET